MLQNDQKQEEEEEEDMPYSSEFVVKWFLDAPAECSVFQLRKTTRIIPTSSVSRTPLDFSLLDQRVDCCRAGVALCKCSV